MMASPQRRSFNTFHKDLIHDVAFNYYGDMIATCSSDQSIQIFQSKQSAENQWILQQTISSKESEHTASIQMITWAHPCFGSIFASCSTDRKIGIFALQLDASSHASTAYQKKNSQKQLEKHKFVRMRLLFLDAIFIAFAPQHFGLS